MKWASFGSKLTYIIITMYFTVLYILLDDFFARIITDDQKSGVITQ